MLDSARASGRGVGRALKGILASLAIACVLLVSVGTTPASATIDTSATAQQLAQVIVANPSTLVGASFVTVPPSGTPNGVSTTPIAGFPTTGSDYAILTTGDASLAAQPPGTNPGGTNDNGGNIRGNSDYDVTILKVDVNVPAADNCLLGFDFKFLSEEYPVYVGTQYNDAFIAELDHSTWTTNGSQISAPDNFAFDPTHNPITINAAGPASMTAANASGTPYGGATPTLSASTPITPGAHSIYFSIFDQGDHILDSAVFIDNLSFGSVADPATQCVPGAHSASWTPLGPNFVTDNRGSSYADSGRVTALAPDPGSKGLYVGTVGGGVWRVDRSNATWTQLSDNAPTLSIGALALIHPTSGGSVLLAGTGEQAEPRSYGIGIMRGVIANNGSVSWSVVASLPWGSSVQQIVVDQHNPDRLLAATSAGLYMSTDSGLTWTQRLSGNFTAVAPDPSALGSFLAAQTTGVDHSACSATIWKGPFFTAGPPALSYPVTGMSSGPFAANVALTSSLTQSFALASDCSGKFVASLAYVPAGRSGTFHWQAFASDAFTGIGPGLFEYPSLHSVVGQGTLDNVIAAVPGTSCSVIVGGIGLYQVTTGKVSGGCSGSKPIVIPLCVCLENPRTMHEDMHALAFDKGTLYVGNDGGLWSTPSLPAKLTTWHDHLKPGQSISTFYEGEAVDKTHLIGGLQDDGTVSTVANGSTNSWSQASSGGDGGYSYALNGAPKYFEQTLDIYDYTTPGAGPIGACHTIDTSHFPYRCSNGDNTQFPDPPLLVDTLDNDPNNILEATNQVYRSTSGGQGWECDTCASLLPPLTASAGYIAGLGFTCGSDCPDYIAAAAVDWRAAGGPKIFTASAFGAVRVGQDIGTGLPQPSPATKIPDLPWVSGLAIDPCIWSSSNNCGGNHEAWVTLQENGRGAVYHTNDYQSPHPEWTPVGTFNTPVTSLAVVSTPNGDNNHVDVYVGTANEGVLTCGGCYGDAPHVNWSQVGNGLPNAWVSNVSCSADGKSLIAWTYGRGAWAISLSSNPTGCVSSQQSDFFR